MSQILTTFRVWREDMTLIMTSVLVTCDLIAFYITHLGQAKQKQKSGVANLSVWHTQNLVRLVEINESPSWK